MIVVHSVGQFTAHLLVFFWSSCKFFCHFFYIFDEIFFCLALYFRNSKSLLNIVIFTMNRDGETLVNGIKGLNMEIRLHIIDKVSVDNGTSRKVPLTLRSIKHPMDDRWIEWQIPESLHNHSFGMKVSLPVAQFASCLVLYFILHEFTDCGICFLVLMFDPCIYFFRLLQ